MASTLSFKLSAEEKSALLDNLDIELTHRTAQFEASLQSSLEAFRLHAEAQLSRLPRAVREMSVREFVEVYGGNVERAVLGGQQSVGEETEDGKVGKEERKRKWVESIEEEKRRAKTARTNTPSPKKKIVSSTSSRARLVSVKSTASSRARTRTRALSSSPRKPPIPPHLLSPSKLPHPSPSTARTPAPSRSVFNPKLREGTIRKPRKDEKVKVVVMSENGTPLAMAPSHASSSSYDERESPLNLSSQEGHRTFEEHRYEDYDEDEDEEDDTMRLRPSKPSQAKGKSKALDPTSESDPTRSPSARAFLSTILPKPLKSSSSGTFTLKLSGSGEAITFDPLTTSPGGVLEGLTPEAREKAREELKKVMEGLGKWKI